MSTDDVFGLDVIEDEGEYQWLDREDGVYIQPAELTIYKGSSEDFLAKEGVNLRDFIEQQENNREEWAELFEDGTITLKRIVAEDIGETSRFYREILDAGNVAALDSELTDAAALDRDEDSYLGIGKMTFPDGNVDYTPERRLSEEEWDRLQEKADSDAVLDGEESGGLDTPGTMMMETEDRPYIDEREAFDAEGSRLYLVRIDEATGEIVEERLRDEMQEINAERVENRYEEMEERLKGMVGSPEDDIRGAMREAEELIEYDRYEEADAALNYVENELEQLEKGFRD